MKSRTRCHEAARPAGDLGALCISEISTAACSMIARDPGIRIRVMKTQMRSRWEIFESTKDTRRQTSGQGESGRESRDGLVETAEKAKGSSDEEERREEHEQGGCAAGTPNVTRRCPYLFAIISARFHRFGHGTAQCGAVRRRDRARASVRTKVLCRHLRYRTAGRVHNNTSWNMSRHPRRRCENRSCVTTNVGTSDGIESSHDCPSLCFPCLPCVS